MLKTPTRCSVRLRLLALLVPCLAGAAAVSGCAPRRPMLIDAGEPQVQTFQTLDRLASQIEALPDKDARDEMMATLERLRGQVVFGNLRMPPAARLLLVSHINVLPMTQVADWTGDGVLDGFEVQVEALDAFGDPVKLVGRLFFELYEFRPGHADRRAMRQAFWEVNIETAYDSLRFWDRFNRTYHFNLVWDKTPQVGRRYIFQVTYLAPWGEVFESQRILTRTDMD